MYLVVACNCCLKYFLYCAHITRKENMVCNFVVFVKFCCIDNSISNKSAAESQEMYLEN